MRLRVVTLSVLGALVLAAGAKAQTDVESLPGDRKGPKLPFQKTFFLMPEDGSCTHIKEVELPAGSWTIETVTARRDSAAFHIPMADIATWVGGEQSYHQISLVPMGSYAESDGTARKLFVGTHAVRLHHESERGHPLVLEFVNVGPKCQGGFSDGLAVSLAGYWRPEDIQF